jgi:hypothetical protein
VRTGADELLGDGHRVDKAAADRLYVEGGRAVVVAELVLQQRSGAGKHVIGRRGGDDDQVEVVGFASRRLQRAAARFQRQVAAGHAGRGQVAVRMPVRSTIHSSDDSSTLRVRSDRRC